MILSHTSHYHPDPHPLHHDQHELNPPLPPPLHHHHHHDHLEHDEYPAHNSHPNHDLESVIDTSDEAAQEQTVPSGTTEGLSASCNCKHPQANNSAHSYETRILQDMTQRGRNGTIGNHRVVERAGAAGIPKVAKRPLTVPKSPQLSKPRIRAIHSGPTTTSNSSSYHPYKGTSFGAHPIARPRIPSQQPQTQYRSYRSGITERGLINSAESARRLSKDKASLHSTTASTLSSRATQLSRGGAGPIRIRPATGATVASSQRAAAARPQHHAHVHHAPVTKPKLTVPQPFNLRTQSRGERHQEQFKNKLVKWKQIEKEHQFKALPLPAHRAPLFVPKKSTKPLTCSAQIVLQTDKRAEEREHYEQERRQKELVLEDIKAAKAREDELRELQEIRRLRQQTVVKLTPIRHYSPIEIHKSTKPLTTPHSPNIGEKRKRMEGAGYGTRSYHSAYDSRTEAEESGLEDHHEVDGYGHPIEPQHHRLAAPLSARKPLTPQQRLANFEQRRSIQRPTSTTTQSSIALTMVSPSKRPIAVPAPMRRISREIASSSSDNHSSQQQNRVRAEIERQRAKDLAYTPPSTTSISLEQKLQEIQEQHESQMLREKLDHHQQAQDLVNDAPALENGSFSTSSRYYKRARPSEMAMDSASEWEEQPPLPPVRRPMGRKSWLEANDL
ncbi:hypothetical protein EMPS_03594 [Entomortierella parvispora]|uniref:TPX2 C-terminal domain-containing protein n=1 Tax=Entomortierella parvispora TaxID=205924 RepID=A0A9P3LUT0_9FUNG|nr:hypothetical protein EMPS_03594 [Entomortierella parvispora]